MNKEKILAMEAGRDLDALVAEKVMGHPMPEIIPEDAIDLYLSGTPIHHDSWTCVFRYDEGDVPKWVPDPYSTDISAAWQVVERVCNWDSRDAMITIKGQGKNPTPLEDNDGEWWEVMIDDDSARQWLAEGKTAPEAICKAALLKTIWTRSKK